MWEICRWGAWYGQTEQGPSNNNGIRYMQESMLNNIKPHLPFDHPIP